MADTANPIVHSEQRIRERAYEIYLSRNGGDGDELSDRLAAQQQLKGSTDQQPEASNDQPQVSKGSQRAAKNAKAAVASL